MSCAQDGRVGPKWEGWNRGWRGLEGAGFDSLGGGLGFGLEAEEAVEDASGVGHEAEADDGDPEWIDFHPGDVVGEAFGGAGAAWPTLVLRKGR